MSSGIVFTMSCRECNQDFDRNVLAKPRIYTQKGTPPEEWEQTPAGSLFCCRECHEQYVQKRGGGTALTGGRVAAVAAAAQTPAAPAGGAAAQAPAAPAGGAAAQAPAAPTGGPLSRVIKAVRRFFHL